MCFGALLCRFRVAAGRGGVLVRDNDGARRKRAAASATRVAVGHAATEAINVVGRVLAMAAFCKGKI